MNYLNINDAGEILEAFRICNDAGEKIELFECLASRSSPPISAFVEILEKIQLEDILALTIQAFEKITDANIKEQLKQSEELLQLLSEKAKPGTSDLIRWAAAGAIETIGFDFIMVAQYLKEEPKKTFSNLVKSTYKRFSEKNLLQSNNYDEFVRFWTYGATFQLRGMTSSIDIQTNDENIINTITRVVENQGIYGIRQTNSYLKKAEEHDYPNENSRKLFENELFETACQKLSSQLLNHNPNSKSFSILIKNQIHCLQSNSLSVRKDAAATILQLNKKLLGELPYESNLLLHGIIAADKYLGKEFYYNELDFLKRKIREAAIINKSVSRIGVSQYFKNWREHLEGEKQRLEEEERRRVEEEQERRRVEEEQERRRVEEEQRKISQIKSCLENASLEIKEINPNFVSKLKVLKMDLEKDLYTLKQACIDAFEQEISSINTEISSLASERDKNSSSAYSSTNGVEGEGGAVFIICFIVFAVITAFTGVLIASCITGLIAFMYLAASLEKRNKNNKLKLKIDKRHNYINILEKHRGTIVSIN